MQTGPGILRAEQSGFTLLELMITLAVAAVLATAAAPGLRAFVQNNRAAAQTNELIAALTLARSEAMTRGQFASVCASLDGASCSAGNSWETGWLVFEDRTAPAGALDAGDVVLRAYSALEGGTALAGSASAVSYRPDGFLNAAVPETFDLTIPHCTGDQGRRITIGLPGRASVDHVAC